MSSQYEILTLPTLPNCLSYYIHRCVVGLPNAVWYYLDYIGVLEMHCIIACVFLQ